VYQFARVFILYVQKSTQRAHTSAEAAVTRTLTQRDPDSHQYLISSS